MGPCRRSRENPKEDSCWFFKRTANPSAGPNLEVKHSQGGVNCESATVMLRERGREGEKKQNKTKKLQRTALQQSQHSRMQ